MQGRAVWLLIKAFLSINLSRGICKMQLTAIVFSSAYTCNKNGTNCQFIATKPGPVPIPRPYHYLISA